MVYGNIDTTFTKWKFMVGTYVHTRQTGDDYYHTIYPLRRRLPVLKKSDTGRNINFYIQYKENEGVLQV